MDLFEAIPKRISCRAYTDQEVEADKVAVLHELVERVNGETGLHFQLYQPSVDGSTLELNRKMFEGSAPLYAALVAKAGPIVEEQLGYHGERLVLTAAALGLSSCWVASTFDRETVTVQLADGEVLHDVVPIGYAPSPMPLKQRTIRAGIRARDKKKDELYEGPVPFAQVPAWIHAAIEAVHAGPSAVNEQPVVFRQDAADVPVRATLLGVKSGREYVDLGIAKLHFELAAAAHGVVGSWQWGDGGAFELREA
jgi:nitroreductase